MIRLLSAPPRIPGDFGQAWISDSIAVSKPDNVRNMVGLFERQTTAKRRASGLKASASRMAIKFAKGIQL